MKLFHPRSIVLLLFIPSTTIAGLLWKDPILSLTSKYCSASDTSTSNHNYAPVVSILFSNFATKTIKSARNTDLVATCKFKLPVNTAVPTDTKLYVDLRATILAIDHSSPIPNLISLSLNNKKISHEIIEKDASGEFFLRYKFNDLSKNLIRKKLSFKISARVPKNQENIVSIQVDSVDICADYMNYSSCSGEQKNSN